LKSCCVLQDHYDNERDVDRVSQPNTRPARPRLRPIFWSQTGLIVRPTASHHITIMQRFTTTMRLRFDGRATSVRRMRVVRESRGGQIEVASHRIKTKGKLCRPFIRPLTVYSLCSSLLRRSWAGNVASGRPVLSHRSAVIPPQSIYIL